MFFFRWCSVVVFTCATVYFSVWVAGGVGEFFYNSDTPRDNVVAVVTIVGMFVVVFGLACLFDQLTQSSTEGTQAYACLVVVTMIYAGTLDPILTYGVWPWQWLTWWSGIPLFLGIVVLLHIIDDCLIIMRYRKYLSGIQ